MHEGREKKRTRETEREICLTNSHKNNLQLTRHRHSNRHRERGRGMENSVSFSCYSREWFKTTATPTSVRVFCEH